MLGTRRSTVSPCPRGAPASVGLAPTRKTSWRPRRGSVVVGEAHNPDAITAADDRCRSTLLRATTTPTSTMHLTAHQVDLLARVMTTLAEPHEEREIRTRVGDMMLNLLGAQYYASYVWDQQRQCFDGGVHINMDPANLEQYERHYQYHDPITSTLQRSLSTPSSPRQPAQPSHQRSQHSGSGILAVDSDDNHGRNYGNGIILLRLTTALRHSSCSQGPLHALASRRATQQPF